MVVLFFFSNFSIPLELESSEDDGDEELIDLSSPSFDQPSDDEGVVDVDDKDNVDVTDHEKVT